MTYKVTIQANGHRFEVEPGETVLAAALRQGVVLPYSCRDGACGSCKARLVAGRVDYGDYQPQALSEAERAAGQALLCQAVPLSDLVIDAREVEAVEDIEVKTLPCRVVRMQRVAHDVMVLHLRLPATQRLQFLAGQYIDLLLKGGERRSFSLANAPHDDAELELHIRYVPGGDFTDYVFNEMREKDLLRLQGPLGTFFLREDSDRPVILLAGGTGFAPIKGMIEHALASRARGGLRRPMHLYWGVRARRDLYMDELARGWSERHELIQYTPVLSEPMAGDHWQGRTGFVHEAVVADYPDLSGHEVYAGGPPVMVEAAKAAFTAHGLPEQYFYYDSFEYRRGQGS